MHKAAVLAVPGTLVLDEYYAYMAKMREKYGDSFLSKMTAKEQALGPDWLFHKPGEPDPE